MQAKCINDSSEEYPNYLGKLSSNKLAKLTKDKLYEVEQASEFEGYFWVIDDLEIKANYKKERFESMNSNFKECLNKECKSNVDNGCRNGYINSLVIAECDERIKLSHTPNYAEEQLEHAKKQENICYNDKCGGKNENNECVFEDNIIKHCGIRQLEYVSLEEQLEKLTKLLAASEAHNKIFSEENERLKKELNMYYEITKERSDYDSVKAENKKLENTRDALVKANNELKETNERLGKSTNEYYYNWIECQEQYKKLELENKSLYEANEYIPDIEKQNEEMKAESNQLRDELQQSEFEIKKYKASEIGYKTIIVNLIEVNKELAKNIYVEELEDQDGYTYCTINYVSMPLVI